MPDPTQLYIGPERRRAEDRITDARLRQLEAQMGDIAVVMRDAVSQGLRDAVSDPALWDAAGNAMAERAQKTAGGWLLGGLRSAANKAALIAAVLLGLYWVGGPAAVIAFIKTQVGH